MQCEELFKQLAFKEGQLSVIMFNMQTLHDENSKLRQEVSSLLKEKESFEVEKKKSYKIGFAAGQKIQSQQKTDEKVSKKETQSNVPSTIVVKTKEEVKFTRNLRWSEYPSDDEASVEVSVKNTTQSKKSKTKRPVKTETQQILRDSFLSNVREISHNYDLAEAAFLAFLEENTFNEKLPDKMFMNFKKGENIFRTNSFVPFYTLDALTKENDKRKSNGQDSLEENDFNFAEMFNALSKKRNKDEKIGYEYELTLFGIPNQAQIIRTNIVY